MGVLEALTVLTTNICSKYFPIVPGCQAPYLDCKMGVVYEDPDTGLDKGNSGVVIFNAAIAGQDGTLAQQRANEWLSVNSTDHRDLAKKASAYVDGNNTFWTWLSKEDMYDSCKSYRDSLRGIFVWSINQDDGGPNGGTHFDALQRCLSDQ